VNDMEWHTKGAEQIAKELHVSTKKGLTSEEAERRQHKYGLNEIKKTRGPSPLRIFFEQFTSPIVWILIIATIVSAFLHEYIDAIVIGVIVIMNAILGFAQEYKAERAIEALQKMAAQHSKVMRNGRVDEIESKYLVPGDIVMVETGDKVPADARLVEVINLQTMEAPLTGESTPVEKTKEIVKNGTIIGDRHNMMFAGTTITRGRAKAIVTETGMTTEFGKIAELMQHEEETETPLQKKFTSIAKLMTVVAVAIIVITFGLGILRGEPILTILLVAISLAVAAVPEGLPAVITISLAIGVQRMAKRNALIRKLPSAETLGSVSIICTDKTGTLTHNEMTVRHAWVYDETVNISGSGYSTKGFFTKNSKAFDAQQNKATALLLKIGMLCNNTKLKQEGRKISAIGDPTEAALIISGEKAGLDSEKLNTKFPREGEVEFTSERKRMSTLHTVNDKRVAFTKGAVDILLNHCDRIYVNGKAERLTKERKKQIIQQNEKFAQQALRVLGFAYREVKKSTKIEEIEKEMTFVGMQAMIDPPRDGVKPALQRCKEAHIDVVMITGDHKTTAEAVAREIGLKGDVLTGKELEKLSPKQLKKKVENVRIYARVNPAHKLKIVEALRANKHIVAMTGDGVNDAPALKKADIGIAMGMTGTDVSKEASDMILTDDNFASIVNAVEEGRGVYDNIRKFFAFLFSGNIGEVAVILIAILMGLPLPLTATLILLINLVTDGLPAVALGVDPFEPEAMKSKPRDTNIPIYRNMNGFLTGYPVIMTFVTLALFWFTLRSGDTVRAQAVAFLTIAMFEMYQAFAARSVKFSSFKVGLFKNKYLVAAVSLSIVVCLSVIYIPALQKIFFAVDTYKPWLLSGAELIVITVLSSLGFIYLEIMKIRRKHITSNPKGDA
jgi:P-type Ca2+ transporter type 2C